MDSKEYEMMCNDFNNFMENYIKCLSPKVTKCKENEYAFDAKFIKYVMFETFDPRQNECYVSLNYHSFHKRYQFILSQSYGYTHNYDDIVKKYCLTRKQKRHGRFYYFDNIDELREHCDAHLFISNIKKATLNIN